MNYLQQQQQMRKEIDLLLEEHDRHEHAKLVRRNPPTMKQEIFNKLSLLRDREDMPSFMVKAIDKLILVFY